VRSASANAQLPLLGPPPRWRAELRRAVAFGKSALRRRDPDAAPVQRAQLAWAEDQLQWVRAGDAGVRTQTLEAQAIAIGDLAFLGLNGEVFARYQLELEGASPVAHTVVCDYANGCLGHVPTAEEYARGGYEVERAFKVYPALQAVAPESEGLVRRVTHQVLEAVGEAETDCCVGGRGGAAKLWRLRPCRCCGAAVPHARLRRWGES